MSRSVLQPDTVDELAAAFLRTSFSPSPSSAPLDGLRPHKIARGPKSSFTMVPQESELDTSDEELRLLGSSFPSGPPVIMPTIAEERPHDLIGEILPIDDDLLGSSEDSSETRGTSHRRTMGRVPSSERTSYSYRRRLKRTCADLFESHELATPTAKVRHRCIRSFVVQPFIFSCR